MLSCSLLLRIFVIIWTSCSKTQIESWNCFACCSTNWNGYNTQTKNLTNEQENESKQNNCENKMWWRKTETESHVSRERNGFFVIVVVWYLLLLRYSVYWSSSSNWFSLSTVNPIAYCVMRKTQANLTLLFSGNANAFSLTIVYFYYLYVSLFFSIFSMPLCHCHDFNCFWLCFFDLGQKICITTIIIMGDWNPNKCQKRSFSSISLSFLFWKHLIRLMEHTKYKFSVVHRKFGCLMM